MHHFETSGSWREMGRQYAEQAADKLRACVEHYAKWLLDDPAKYMPRVEGIRALAKEHVPELLEETAGMAEASGIEEPTLLGFRCFPDVKNVARFGCSVVFLGDAYEGPLLGRNCDLEPGFSHEMQSCRVCRPTNGPARIVISYLGVAGGVGLNEHGLATGTASAHTNAQMGSAGLPGAFLQRMLLGRCRNAAEARALLAQHAFLGKPQNLMAADAGGDACLFELAPGMIAPAMARRPGRSWLACTNFFVSGRIAIKPEVKYLESAYARYGRIVHALDGNLVSRSVPGLRRLVLDIAQPGLCQPAGGNMETAHSTVADLRARRLHVHTGPPAAGEWREVAL